MLYQFMYTVENLLSKMYIEGALMSKSRNIALTDVVSECNYLQKQNKQINKQTSKQTNKTNSL